MDALSRFFFLGGLLTPGRRIGFGKERLSGDRRADRCSTGRLMHVWANLLGPLSHQVTLRRGSCGEAVRRLQERLRALGYEVGPVDGRYGYMTEDAVAAFQRDHRLRVDGIAGPRVLAALAEEIPRRYRVHVVRQSERLADIARLYGVSVSALRWMNGLPRRARLRPGRTLRVWETYVLLGAGDGVHPDLVGRALAGCRRAFSGIASPPRPWNGSDAPRKPEEQGTLERLARALGRDYFVTLTGGERPLAELLTRRRTFSRFLAELEDPARRADGTGLLLELGSIPWGAGGRLVAALARLRRALRPPLVVSIPPLPAGWRAWMAGLDPSALARQCDGIVLATHEWERIGPLLAAQKDPFSPIEAWVARAVREIPSWKLWLGVPLDACRTLGRGHWERLPYRRAVTEGYRLRLRPRPLPSGFLALDASAHPGGWRAYLASVASLHRFLRLVFRFRLGGLYLHPLGGEERRFLDAAAERLKAAPPLGPST